MQLTSINGCVIGSVINKFFNAETNKSNQLFIRTSNLNLINY